MPNYGQNIVAPGFNVSYADWVDIASSFIDYELSRDPRPIVLYGLSAGGMLTYHVAAKNQKVKGIIGMTFLDQHNQQVRDETTFNLFMSRIGVPLANIAVSIPLLNRISIPISMASKMWALSNLPEAMAIFRLDKTSAAAWTSMRFLGSYMTYRPAVEPDEFEVCPVFLTQPMEDRWTQLGLGELFLGRVKKVVVRAVELEGGHYPMEEPGLGHMADAIVGFLRGIEEGL